MMRIRCSNSALAGRGGGGGGGGDGDREIREWITRTQWILTIIII